MHMECVLRCCVFVCQYNIIKRCYSWLKHNPVSVYALESVKNIQLKTFEKCIHRFIDFLFITEV